VRRSAVVTPTVNGHVPRTKAEPQVEVPPLKFSYGAGEIPPVQAEKEVFIVYERRICDET